MWARRLYLLRLYPRWWRERYGEEFTDLVVEMSVGRRGVGLVIDVARGALDAHLHRRPAALGRGADTAVRRGLYDGLIISGVLVVVVVLSNAVFPPGPQDSDSDPESLIWLTAGYAVLAVGLVVIGARARRRSETPLAGGRGGATAGVVIAVLVTATFLVMNNLFFDIVSRQHDKRVAFAASGWSSTRAYLTVGQLEGAVVLIPVTGLVGAALGFLGGAVWRPRPSTSG